MQKNKTIFILGLAIALLPHTGFPRSWSSVLFTLFGLSIAALSWARRQGPEEPFSHHPEGESEQAALAHARSFVAEEIAQDERVEEVSAVSEDVPSTAQGVAEETAPAAQESSKRRPRQATKRVKKEKSFDGEGLSPVSSAVSPVAPLETER